MSDFAVLADLGASRCHQAAGGAADRAAAAWWSGNRAAAPDAVRQDLQSALSLLAHEPELGTRVEMPRPEVVRRLYLGKIRYFAYYRIRRDVLEVIAFWHESRDGSPPV
ncbi:MAG: type II toxin-antitoxin system RelE/ParE family toxin [Betaproteobacteria bacterium]|nr:type II toxin-antitoxin system RelE/ParE family toxin [Betaproteobacteria bacterium]